eukprot:TRINITY_DN6350_c0_g1_i1.p1 TRINITY_DN6350_c0_g1~~TRINITY_DN6350_c0_g1_i1.p1  ORF type:complete len:549 (-),score=178.47 TRINITY_DN6350_c0_g1_i1:24-1670(-)
MVQSHERNDGEVVEVETEKVEAVTISSYLTRGQSYVRLHLAQIIKTLIYTLCFIVMGSVIGILGPALKFFEYQTHATADEMGWVFVCRGTGWLIGALFAGPIYDRFPFQTNLILTVDLALLAVINAVIPISSFFLVLGLHFCLAFGCGFIDVGGNTLVVWIWDQKVAPWMQFIHFGFGLGTVLSPLLIGCYQFYFTEHESIKLGYWTLSALSLVCAVLLLFVPSPEKPVERVEMDDSEKNVKSVEMEMLDEEGQVMEEIQLDLDHKKNVHLKPIHQHSVDVGPMDEIIAVHPPSSQLDQVHKKEQNIEKSSGVVEVLDESPQVLVNVNPNSTRKFLGKPMDFWTIMLVGVFLCVYVGAEVGFGGYIYSFSVDMGWASAQTSDFLTAIYWSCFTLGRLLAIPFSLMFSSTIMLIIDMLGGFFSMVLLSAAVLLTHFFPWFTYGPYIMFFSTGMLGLSLASVFPCAINLPTDFSIQVTGSTTSIMVMWASFGELTVPLTMALLFTFISPETMPFAVAFVFLLAMGAYFCIKFSTGVTWRQWLRVNRVETM